MEISVWNLERKLSQYPFKKAHKHCVSQIFQSIFYQNLNCSYSSQCYHRICGLYKNILHKSKQQSHSVIWTDIDFIP